MATQRTVDDYLTILQSISDDRLNDKKRWLKACEFNSFFYALKDGHISISSAQESHVFNHLNAVVENIDLDDELRAECLGLIACGFATHGFMTEKNRAYGVVSLATTSSNKALRHRALTFFARCIETKIFPQKSELFYNAYDILVDSWNMCKDTETGLLLAKSFIDIVMNDKRPDKDTAISDSTPYQTRYAGPLSDSLKGLPYIMMDSLIYGERDTTGKRSFDVQKQICQGLLRCYEAGRFDNDAFMALTVLDKCQNFIWPGLQGKIVEDFNRYSGNHFPNIFLHEKLSRIAHLVLD